MSFFKKLTNIISFFDPAWHNTLATYTGECMDVNPDDKMMNTLLKIDSPDPSKLPTHLYEVTYEAYGREIHAWHSFPADAEPDPKELAGTTIEIRFLENNPQLFERIA